MEDPAVAVVVDFYWRVDATRRGEFDFGAVGFGGGDLDVLAGATDSVAEERGAVVRAVNQAIVDNVGNDTDDSVRKASLRCPWHPSYTS